jgi:hypothetical protein
LDHGFGDQRLGLGNVCELDLGGSLPHVDQGFHPSITAAKLAVV